MNKIILFDGVCNLCNGAVKFVLINERKKQIKFASLQSNIGQYFLEKYSLPTTDFNSFIFIDNDKLYTKSTAALKVVREMNNYYKWLYILIVIPRPLRDLFYTFIAKHRYTIFGKNNTCMIPTLENKRRFLNEIAE